MDSDGVATTVTNARPSEHRTFDLLEDSGDDASGDERSALTAFVASNPGNDGSYGHSRMAGKHPAV